MPPEVFDLWIVPLIDASGWPFSSVNDSVIGTEWDRFLIGRPLSFWATVEWRLLSLPMTESVYHPETALRVRWIVGNCALGEQTPTADLQDTKKRFRTAASFIQVNGQLPSPIVGITTREGFEIVDGHHRLAALNRSQLEAHGIARFPCRSSNFRPPRSPPCGGKRDLAG